MLQSVWGRGVRRDLRHVAPAEVDGEGLGEVGFMAFLTTGRSAAVWAGVVVTAVLATACTSGSPSTSAPSTGGNGGSASVSSSGSPPSSANPADVARQHATATYLGMWEDMAVAAETSNWQDPRLAQHATGLALTNITRGLYTDSKNGLVSKGRPKNDPQVSSADPPADPVKVIISDCGDSTNWIQYRVDTGQPADNSPGGRRQINAIVEKQPDGAWRVTDFGIHGIGSC
jgi:hypothetical protein